MTRFNTMKHRVMGPAARTGLTLLTLSLLSSGCSSTVPAIKGKNPAISPDPTLLLQFTRIPEGCFQMGAVTASTSPPGHTPTGPSEDELPRHKVCVDSFLLGTHEVTREQWQFVMGEATVPADAKTHPQSHITWSDAQRFITRLNQYNANVQYRLPTEAEWEYACLAGTDESDLALNTAQYVKTLQQQAWYIEPMRTEAHSRPVGELKPNAWGLYDMQGNLWEWTADSYTKDAYQQHQTHNPYVEGEDGRHVIRGGSYTSRNYQVRCGTRGFGIDDDPLPTQGLRLVKVIINDAPPDEATGLRTQQANQN